MTNPTAPPWNTVSASQIEAYLACPTSYHFTYILGQRAPSTGGQNTGTLLHSVAQSALTNQPPPVIPPEIMRYAAELVNYLAPAPLAAPVPPPRSELYFTMPTFQGGPLFNGYIDAYYTGAVPRVVDFKTTSAARYAKSADEIAQSIQMLAYGRYALLDHPNAPSVTLEHVHVLTKGKPRVWSTSVTLGREHVLKAWDERIIPAIHEIAAARQITEIAKTDPRGLVNGHCNAYGGCGFKVPCSAARMSSALVSVSSLFTPRKAPPMEAAPTTPLVIYVDCIPTKGNHHGRGESVADYLAPIVAAVNTANGVVDYKQIQYQAAGALALGIRTAVAAGQLPKDGVLLLDRSIPGASAVLEILGPLAEQIVYGVR